MIATMTVEDMFHETLLAHEIWDYDFKYDNRASRLMACQYVRAYRDRYGNYDPTKSKFIFHISKRFLQHLPEKEIMDTVLHEVAHALTDPRKPAHGAEWRRTCIALGGDGERLHRSTPEQQKAMYKWEGTCPNGHKIYKNRLTQRVRFYNTCAKCSPYHNMEYTFTWKELR